MKNRCVGFDAYYIYAVFSLNTKSINKKWFLNGFWVKSKVRNISNFPECAPNSGIVPSINVEKELAIHDGCYIDNATLLVTAVSVEYDQLLEVLNEDGYDYVEGKITDVGARELNYIFIDKLKTYAILAGQSFECIIPLVQSILAFKPKQAILGGISFSFDMSKAAFGTIVVSNHVWDYESAKVNEDGTNHRGNKVQAGSILRQLFTEKLSKRVPVKKGDYASGMKIVNSLEYQKQIKDVEPEVLAGDQESFFFAHTCDEFKINWIVIKAISDYGYGKKDNYQQTSSFAALEYIIKGIKSQK